MNQPLDEVMANLHPCRKPGSSPITTLPLNGGVSKTRFKFAAKTSIEALSALFVNSDLQRVMFCEKYLH